MGDHRAARHGDVVLEVRDLSVDYAERRGRVTRRALDGINLEVRAGEGHAIVGRSGSGKTTAARAVVRLVELSSGSVVLNGRDLAALSRRELRRVRSQVQMVFQDPQTSLDPRWRVGRSIAEPLRIARTGPGARIEAEVASLLDRVGLPAVVSRRYPHELSIGQQQRVAIARALAPGPSLLICDEPVAALDTSVQAQILELVSDLQRERSLGVLLVTHDLAVAAQLCSTMTVLDEGRVVEHGPTRDILAVPHSDRAVALIDAARRLDPDPPIS